MLGSRVDASATLELLMVRFDNPTGEKSNGDSCDGLFADECDYTFRFSLYRGHRCTQIFRNFGCVLVSRNRPKQNDCQEQIW